MRYRSLCLLISLGIAAPLWAQDSKLPPLPTGPLLKRAPSYSTWTIAFQGHPVEHADSSTKGATDTPAEEGRNKEKEPTTKVSTVTKTGSTILEQTVDASGQQNQVWHSSGVRIVPVPGSSNPMVCPDYGGGDIMSINFASSDFAGLDWLSQNTYSGMEKYQGVDCIVFKGSVSPLGVRDQIDERAYIEQAKALGQKAPEEAKVPAVAYIDLETRLPLYVQFGNEKRTYQYGPPPSTPLALPSELASAMEEYAKRIKRLSAPPTRAY